MMLYKRVGDVKKSIFRASCEECGINPEGLFRLRYPAIKNPGYCLCMTVTGRVVTVKINETVIRPYKLNINYFEVVK